MNGNKKSLVSVIIPTLNSGEFLEKCLISVKNQSYPRVEIIVVDNYSSDGTANIAKKYTKKFFLKGPERSSQRNYGAKISKGKYLLFIDSDMKLDKDVVSECVEVISSDSKIGGVIIPEISVGEGFWVRCKALERECYIGDDTIEATRFFEKKIFLDVGGFDIEMVSAEDWDLHNRVKKKVRIARISSLIKHYELDFSLWKTVKKKYYYGKFLHFYLSKNYGDSKKKFTLFRSGFLRNWKKLIKNPFVATGMFFMKFCEFLAAGIGLIFIKVKK